MQRRTRRPLALTRLCHGRRALRHVRRLDLFTMFRVPPTTTSRICHLGRVAARWVLRHTHITTTAHPSITPVNPPPLASPTVHFSHTSQSAKQADAAVTSTAPSTKKLTAEMTTPFETCVSMAACYSPCSSCSQSSLSYCGVLANPTLLKLW